MMQIVLVYLYRRHSLLKFVSQAEIVKNSNKTPYFGDQGHSSSTSLLSVPI